MAVALLAVTIAPSCQKEKVTTALFDDPFSKWGTRGKAKLK